MMQKEWANLSWPIIRDKGRPDILEEIQKSARNKLRDQQASKHMSNREGKK